MDESLIMKGLETIIRQITTKLDQTILKVLQGDERIAIIVGVSYIEALLEQLLDKNFITNKSKNISAYKVSPLETLSAKLQMTHLLGIIDEPTFDALYKLKNLRNDCAHKISLEFNKGQAHASKLEHIFDLVKESPICTLLLSGAKNSGLDIDSQLNNKLFITLSSIIVSLELMVVLANYGNQELKVFASIITQKV